MTLSSSHSMAFSIQRENRKKTSQYLVVHQRVEDRTGPFQHQLIHAESGKLTKNSRKICIMQKKLNQPCKRYDDEKIHLSKEQRQLSLLVGTKSK